MDENKLSTYSLPKLYYFWEKWNFWWVLDTIREHDRMTRDEEFRDASWNWLILLVFRVWNGYLIKMIGPTSFTVKCKHSLYKIDKNQFVSNCNILSELSAYSNCSFKYHSHSFTLYVFFFAKVWLSLTSAVVDEKTVEWTQEHFPLLTVSVLSP